MKALKLFLAFLVVFCAACVSTPKQETPVLPNLEGKTVTIWIVAGWERSDAQVGTVEGEIRKDPSPWRRILWKVAAADPVFTVTYDDLLAALSAERKIDMKFEMEGASGGYYYLKDVPPSWISNTPIKWEVLESGSSVDLIAEVPGYTLEEVTPPRFIKVLMKR